MGASPAAPRCLAQVVRTGHAVFLAHDGDYARFENRGNDKTLDFMLIEAQPTGENVAMRVRARSRRRSSETINYFC